MARVLAWQDEQAFQQPIMLSSGSNVDGVPNVNEAVRFLAHGCNDLEMLTNLPSRATQNR
jgi:hypothetical protein